MPKVTVIPPSINRTTRQSTTTPTRRKVAAYARVSNDFEEQLTSYEAQISYYTNYIQRNPDWEFVKIYTDEVISATSTKHREGFNSMITDALNEKIDLIITKSVSRLARNTVDCITMVRNLTELRNPVGVFFESECIFSLNEDTSMPLSFLASIAENESRIRSRSMEVSLAQRLNGGLPLTPKLLGYSHDTDGKLVINPDEAPTVKLIFYMYLSGYSSAYHEHQKSLQINIFDGYAIYGIKDNTVSSIASGEAATPIPGTHRPEVPVQEEIKNG